MTVGRSRILRAMKRRISKTKNKRETKSFSNASRRTTGQKKEEKPLKSGDNELLDDTHFDSAQNSSSWKKNIPVTLQHVGENSIRNEIEHYFQDMTICRNLKRFGSSVLHDDFSQLSLYSKVVEYQKKKRSRTEKMITELYQMMGKTGLDLQDATLAGTCPATLLPSISGASSSPACPFPFAVHCSDVKTRMMDAEICQVLTSQIAILAQTELCVHVEPSFAAKVSLIDDMEKRRNEERMPTLEPNLEAEGEIYLSSRKRSRVKAREYRETDSSSVLPLGNCDPMSSTTTTVRKNTDLGMTSGKKESFSLSFLSTHFLEFAENVETPTNSSKIASSSKATSSHTLTSTPQAVPSEPWCAIQSLICPKSPLHLEFYTHHMLHFGLLCYSVWNASSSVLREALLLSKHSSADWRAVMTSENVAGQHASLTRWPQYISHFFPSSHEDRILILGLGGNVLGSCLDACLAKEVAIDVVEIEPAMLNICHRNGLTPRLSAPVPIGSEENRRGASVVTSTLRSNRKKAGSVKSACSTFSSTVSFSHKNVSRNPSKETIPFAEALAAPWLRYDVLINQASSPAFPASSEKFRSHLGLLTQREAYHFYIMDANDFLQYRSLVPVFLDMKNGTQYSTAHAAPPRQPSKSPKVAVRKRMKSIRHRGNETHSNDEKSSSCMRKDFISASVISSLASPSLNLSTPSLKYNLIFLDCYDPHQGTMMHNSCLITRCKNRLSPGGALLINAHVDTHEEILTKYFLTKGFGSVQVLKVAGCRQCIVVCLLDGEDTKDENERFSGEDKSSTVISSSSQFSCVDAAQCESTIKNSNEDAALSSRVNVSVPSERFQLRVLQRFATYLNHCLAASFSVQSLVFDPEWLQRSSSVSSGYVKMGDCSKTKTNRLSPCRVWEHHS